MSYYIRLLTPSKAKIDADTLRAGLAEQGRPDVTLMVDETEDEQDWTAIVAYTEAGDPIGLLTRDAVAHESLAAEELEEFGLEMAEALPKSGARWVKAYLPTVKTIYAIQLMAAALDERGAGVPGMMLAALQAELGGICQADGEGFSNEAGHQVVWQFGDDAEGDWIAAVLEKDPAQGEVWRAFKMNLADPRHREAFLAGRVPEGADVVDDA